ncbi:uncharacterized protein N7459_008110 [Penicillium hispanicum]|uniref:uncharacterized protein n=1 Tax=Penicillium hispanicum TaxID=1080232 RepID=UPI00253F869B|nr:uncharacterized protein N7459_008110 [Penicillium hispanicum]KAJ5573683.1 hypothetical protein N7459_008110 [Penicillium hispanicum]
MNTNASFHPSQDGNNHSGKPSPDPSVSLGNLPPELVLEITSVLGDASLANFSTACADLHVLLKPELKGRAKEHALGAPQLYHRNFKYADGATPGIDLPVEVIDRADPNACTKYLPGSKERFGRMVFEGNLDAVRALLDAGVPANSYTSSGAWMLSLAVLSRKTDMVKLLLEHGANPCTQDLILQMSPVAYAARAMHDEILSHLISAGSDLSEPDVMQNIVSSCHPQTVQVALERGPVDAAGYGGETPLHSAVRRGEPAILDMLLPLLSAQTIDARSDAGDTALHLAMQNHDAGLARRLVDAGADLARCNNLGYAPLHCALIHRHFEIAADLIDRGVSLDVMNYRGESALHLAVEAASAGVLRMLLGRNVDVNARGTSSATGLATPLHYAVRRRSPEMVGILLNESPTRPDLTLVDEYGRTPMQAAELFGEMEIVEMLAT